MRRACREFLESLWDTFGLILLLLAIATLWVVEVTWTYLIKAPFIFVWILIVLPVTLAADLGRAIADWFTARPETPQPATRTDIRTSGRDVANSATARLPAPHIPEIFSPLQPMANYEAFVTHPSAQIATFNGQRILLQSTEVVTLAGELTKITLSGILLPASPTALPAAPPVPVCVPNPDRNLRRIRIRDGEPLADEV